MAKKLVRFWDAPKIGPQKRGPKKKPKESWMEAGRRVIATGFVFFRRDKKGRYIPATDADKYALRLFGLGYWVPVKDARVIERRLEGKIAFDIQL